MNTPLLIARRTAGNSSPTQRVMTRIATLAVAVSICVMVITLAVVDGFKCEMNKIVGAISAEITITNPRSLNSTFGRPITSSPQLRSIIGTTDGCTSAYEYISRGGVARSQSGVAAIVLKGVAESYPSERFDALIDEGAFPQMGESRRKELLIARETANALGVKTGDRVELLFMGDGQTPQRELFKVCGIYSIGGNEQAALAITDLRNVRKINGWDESQVSGFEISTDGRRPSAEVVDALNYRLAYEYESDEDVAAIDVRELYGYIFAWLETHDVNAAVIAAIMFIVTLFNMITTLLILVLERTQMVGVLKSMGMDNGAIRRIFLYRAAMIVGIGILVGNIIALALLAIQHSTGIVTLDSSAYYVSRVPVALDAATIITTNLIFVAAILALLYAATAIVSRISPAEAVKYE